MKRMLHDRIIHGNEFESIHSPAFYDCIVHLICLSGTGTFMYNGENFILRENDLAILSSPRNISGIASDDNFRCEYIVAPEEYLHALLPANNYSIVGRVSLFANPIIHIGPEQAARFLRDIRNIASRSKDSDHRFYHEMISGLVRTMIYDLFDFHVRLNDNELITDRVGYITTRFFAMIQEGQPRLHREPSYYAAKLNVSVKYLSETIKRVTGDSVSSHINRAATALIIEYLKSSDLSATQIADRMNFSTVSYFSRYCAKHLGRSPARFRRA